MLPQDYAKLPSLGTITLQDLSAAAIHELDTWLRKTYVQQAQEVISLLSEENQYLMMRETIKEAMELSSQTGAGRRMLLNNAYGLARLIYAYIKKPAFTFDQFHKAIFPEELLTQEGLVRINEMIELIYPVSPPVLVPDVPGPVASPAA